MKRYQVSKHFILTLFSFAIALTLLAVYFIGDERILVSRPLLDSDMADLKHGSYVNFDIDAVLTGKHNDICAAITSGLKTYEYYTVRLKDGTWIRLGLFDEKTMASLKKFKKYKEWTMHLTGCIDRKHDFTLNWYQKSAPEFDLNLLRQDIVINQVSDDPFGLYRTMGIFFLFLTLFLFITIGGIRTVCVRPFEDSKSYRDCLLGRGFDLEKRLEKEEENLRIYKMEQKESRKSILIGLALLILGLLIVSISILIAMNAFLKLFVIGTIVGCYLVFMSPYWFWNGFVNSGSLLAHKVSEMFLLRTTSVKIDETYKMIGALKDHVLENASEQDRIKKWYGPGIWVDEEETEDKKEAEEKLAKERALQEAMLELKHKYGKNAVVKAKNLNKGGTAMERNDQIGGHKA